MNGSKYMSIKSNENKFGKEVLLRRVSILLIFSILISSTLPIITYASNINSLRLEIEENISTNEYLDFLESFGFNDSELIELYQADADNFKTSIKLPEKLSERTKINRVYPEITFRSFPNNPREGDRYTLNYNIHFERAMIEAGLIYGSVTSASAAIATYSPSVIIKAFATFIGTSASILGVASEIYYYIKSNGLRHTGVRGSKQYVYARNNDGTLEWIFRGGTHIKNYY